MIKGIGVDVVEIEKFRKIENNQNFLNQILTENEKSIISQLDFKDVQIATFFALKEAVLKALGMGLYYGYFWCYIDTSEVWNLKLTGYVKEVADKNDIVKINSTFSNTKNCIIALVILEGKTKGKS